MVNSASIDFLLHILTITPSPKRRSGHENSGSEVRAHLAAIGCNGQEISRAHLANPGEIHQMLCTELQTWLIRFYQWYVLSAYALGTLERGGWMLLSLVLGT